MKKRLILTFGIGSKVGTGVGGRVLASTAMELVSTVTAEELRSAETAV